MYTYIINQHIWIYWNNFSISVYIFKYHIVSNNIKARDVHMLFWPAEAQRRQSIAAETSRSGPFGDDPWATPWLPMSGETYGSINHTLWWTNIAMENNNF